MLLSSEEIDGLIHRFSPFTQPGASILVGSRDKILFNQGYGLADVEAGTPADAHTSYLIASVSKQFACAAVMHLAERGKLGLDDSVDRYLPLFPAFGKQVSIRHLMTHTSGIPEYFTPRFRANFCEDKSPELDLTGLLAMIANTVKTLDFEPGSRWEYCNTGYVILQEIIRQTADMSYEDYLGQTFFTPLGMTHTRVGDSGVRPLGMAKGYARNARDQFLPTPYNRAVVGWADGNVISNAPDLFTWLGTIRHGGILSARSWQKILTPATLNNKKPAPYGLGWFFNDRAGLLERWHTGSTIGYHCRVSWFEDQQTAVIWLCNSDAENAPDLNIPFGHLVTHLLGTRMRPMPRWHALPEVLAEKWAGTWINQSHGEHEQETKLTITRLSDGRLSLEGTLKGSQGTWPLIPRADHACWIDSGAHYFLSMETQTTEPPILHLHFHGTTLAFEQI